MQCYLLLVCLKSIIESLSFMILIVPETSRLVILEIDLKGKVQGIVSGTWVLSMTVPVNLKIPVSGSITLGSGLVFCLLHPIK